MISFLSTLRVREHVNGVGGCEKNSSEHVCVDKSRSLAQLQLYAKRFMVSGSRGKKCKTCRQLMISSVLDENRNYKQPHLRGCRETGALRRRVHDRVFLSMRPGYSISYKIWLCKRCSTPLVKLKWFSHLNYSRHFGQLFASNFVEAVCGTLYVFGCPCPSLFST